MYLYSDYTTSIASQYVPQGGVWVYILQKNSNQYDGIKIIPTINQNVTMTIYSSTGTNKYNLERLVNSNSEIKIDVSSYASLYVVAKSDGTKIGKFMFKASLFKNPLSGGAIAGIVIGSIAFCVIFIVIVVWWVRSCKKRAQAKRNMLMNQGQAPIMISNQPNIYQNQYNKPVSQPNQYNQPPYQQYPVSQPGSQPYAYVKPGYPESEPLLQNSPYQVSNTQQPAYPFMPQTNKYLPANPAYPTPGGKE